MINLQQQKIINKYNLELKYEIVVDSSIDKSQPKTILKYKRDDKR